MFISAQYFFVVLLAVKLLYFPSHDKRASGVGRRRGVRRPLWAAKHVVEFWYKYRVELAPVSFLPHLVWLFTRAAYGFMKNPHGGGSMSSLMKMS